MRTFGSKLSGSLLKPEISKDNLQAEECLMVGNDSRHDLAARDVGIPTFLVDTWLIDRCQGDFTADLRGDHSFLLDFIMTIDKQR